MEATPGEHHPGPERFAEPEDEHPLAQLDKITLTSVGIDVGAATSQVIFSWLVLRRLGRALSSRFVVAERDTLYLLPVHFTPYRPGRERIDDGALGRLVDATYGEAGLAPEDVDTGAIILTGEAIRRDNARTIADLFAAQRGNFVCASAGHNFEALLAAHGSGCVALSEARAERILNVDIGGGTTKLAVVDRGRVQGTAALHVGGRLVATDANERIAVLEPGGEDLARAAGVHWGLGQRVAEEDLERVAGYMASIVLAAIKEEAPPPEVEKLFLTPPLPGPRHYDGVVFSGGVGEYSAPASPFPYRRSSMTLLPGTRET